MRTNALVALLLTVVMLNSVALAETAPSPAEPVAQQSKSSQAQSEPAKAQPEPAQVQAQAEPPKEVQGSVTTTAATPAAAASAAEPVKADDIVVKMEEVPLRAYSKGKYKAVQLTIQNAAGGHVELLQGEVPGALNEQFLAHEKAGSGNAKRKALGMGLGLASALPGFGMMGAGSYAAVRGLAVAQHAVNTAAYTVNQLPSGGSEIPSGQYVDRVQNVIISPNQTFTFTTVVPKNQEAHVKLVVRDLQNSRVLDVFK